jgi:hypothetical protein
MRDREQVSVCMDHVPEARAECRTTPLNQPYRQCLVSPTADLVQQATQFFKVTIGKRRDALRREKKKVFTIHWFSVLNDSKCSIREPTRLLKDSAKERVVFVAD